MFLEFPKIASFPNIINQRNQIDHRKADLALTLHLKRKNYFLRGHYAINTNSIEKRP